MSGQLAARTNQAFHAIPAIMFAGTTLAIIETIVGLLLSLVTVYLTVGPSLQLLFAIPFAVLIAGIGSMIFFGAVSFLMTCVLMIFNGTLSHGFRPLTIAGVAGGFTGFISTVWLVTIPGASREWWLIAINTLFGPILATIACHVAGHYRVRRFQHLLAADGVVSRPLTIGDLSTILKRRPDGLLIEQEKKLFEEDSTSKVHPLDESDDMPLEGHDPAYDIPRKVKPAIRKNQWTLFQLFVLMVWVALVAAGITALGELGSVIAFLLVGYAIVQVFSFGVIWILRGVIDRRLQRKTVEFVEGNSCIARLKTP